jgi:broad specificity phosphatase PhoE
VADRLASLQGVALLTSPLRRTRETTASLALRWGIEPEVEPGVGELPTPAGMAPTEASTWLHHLLSARWGDVDDATRAWRDQRLDAVGAIGADAVVVSHFVLINAVIGAATSDDRVTCRHVGNGSITVVDVERGAVALAAEPEDVNPDSAADGPILPG